tara:strand:- start:9272 stop:10099 length:828 start_codon:yes stop_codon:yes gene_type:complete
MDTSLKIYLQDSAFAHCIFSNNPMPPKQFTDKIEWIRDNTFTQDDIVVWTDIDIPNALNRPGKNIVWLIEAYDYIPHLYEFVIKNADNFEAVWTHDAELVSTLPNATLLPYGGCWIDDFDWGVHPKSKDFSIIASAKRQLPGHKMRHQIIAGSQGRVDVFGGGYNPLDNKIDGLRDYRYHFCIENINRDYWFTEKLIDCFVTGTIPIYWGCPSIDDFFNIDGMVCFDELKHLPGLLPSCTTELYESKLDAIKENFELAQKYRLAELTIPSIIEKS